MRKKAIVTIVIVLFATLLVSCGIDVDDYKSGHSFRLIDCLTDAGYEITEVTNQIVVADKGDLEIFAYYENTEIYIGDGDGNMHQYGACADNYLVGYINSDGDEVIWHLSPEAVDEIGALVNRKGP